MSQAPSFVARLIGLVLGVAVLVVGLVFSAILLVIVAALGVVALIYVWWKSRRLRREQGAVIIESAGHYEVREDRPALEGESRRVDDAP